MSVYRFPAIDGLDGFTIDCQLRYIDEELREASRAINHVGSETNTSCSRESYGMELMDIIHATETALRMEFTDDEVEELRAKVIEKNAKRGYYKVGE